LRFPWKRLKSCGSGDPIDRSKDDGESDGNHLRGSEYRRLALDIAQEPARQVVYIENTPMFVQIAEGLGMRSILYTNYRSTPARLAAFGLRLAE
jgi:hypothetical protein